MHLGQSLLSIIRNDTIETDFMQEVDSSSSDFEHFLRYTFVAQLTDRRAVPGLDYKISIEADTETFVEQVIGEYISDGLEDDRYFHKIIPESSQPTIEFSVDCIRNPFWQRFCSMVGRERFLKIVSEAKSFTTQSESIYWSFSRSRPDIAHKSERHLSKAGMMYSTAHSRGNLRVLPESLDIVLKRIEFSDRSHVKSIPKRLRRLRGLLKRAQNRDLRLNYYSLHQSVISEERHQRNETVTHVISFVLIVLKKLFSASYLGCSSNKKLFERFLISYLKSPKKTNLSITALLQKLNLSSVSWLGKNSVTSAKHEDLRKRILFTNFIRWICCTVVSKVVKAFWYVTETSGCIPPKGSSVAFISHEEWSKASSTWLKGYTNENELLRKYGSGNVKLHALKFDMKHCYDNLNQAKVIECIKALFSEKSEEILFFKRFFHYNPHNPNYAKCAKLVADRVQLERLRKASDDKKMTLIRGFSGSKTHIGKLHISSVFDIVLDQVLNGSIMIGNEQNTYYRKRGVFQGTPLSATFCDVLYDRLLKDTCSFLGDAPDTLLIRLADDFLLLSAEPLICKKVFEIVSSESFQEFGAHINQEKCRFYMDSHRSQHVKFVGLDISLPSLEASRNMSTPINLPTKALSSLRALLNQLTRHFVTRTSNEPFTSGRVSPNVLELDMKQILDSISRLG
ncbi:putative group II intron reverse transcriptase/maturase [Candidozyma auris]